MRKSSTRAAVVIGGTLAGVSSTVAFGAQAALFPQAQGSALDGLTANPAQSAPVNSGSTTPTPSATKKIENEKRNTASPTPSATKSTTVKKHKKHNGGTSSTPSATETTPNPSGPVDGTYTGSNAKALNFGYVQVQISVSGGQITDIQFLSYPDRDGRSRSLSESSLPQLRDEALSAQSANISSVSGASWTSRAFKASLSAAITAAGL